MFIQPSLTTNQVDVILPVGEYISIGNTGNESTTVLLQSVAPSAQSWNYSTIGTLFNTAQTFGPYTEDRTIQIQNRNATVEYSIGAQPQLRSFPALVLGNLTPVSLVQPAATFVTLTYANNAGDVKLVSAGVHGLTNAVAQGKDVYITWTGGTATTGFYEVVDADTDTEEVTIDLPYIASTVTITIAAPGVVTWTGHGLSANDTIRFTTTGALPTGLTAGTTYWYTRIDATTGNLSIGYIEFLKTLAEEPLSKMEKAGELSKNGYSVEIDPTQNFLQTSELFVTIKLVPKGVSRNITVNLGFALRIA
jgi:hypothetical protein